MFEGLQPKTKPDSSCEALGEEDDIIRIAIHHLKFGDATRRRYKKLFTTGTAFREEIVLSVQTSILWMHDSDMSWRERFNTKNPRYINQRVKD